MIEGSKKIWIFDGSLFILCWFLLAIIIILTASNIIFFTIFLMLSIFMVSGLYTNGENECCIGTVFGKYAGCLNDSGLFWSNPFMKKIKINTAPEVIKLENFLINDSIADVSFVFKINNPVKFFHQKLNKEYITSKLVGFLNSAKEGVNAGIFNSINSEEPIEALEIVILVKSKIERFDIDKFSEEARDIISEAEDIIGEELNSNQKFDIIKELINKSKKYENQ